MTLLRTSIMRYNQSDSSILHLTEPDEPYVPNNPAENDSP
jgi:hypothetical protein